MEPFFKNKESFAHTMANVKEDLLEILSRKHDVRDIDKEINLFKRFSNIYNRFQVIKEMIEGTEFEEVGEFKTILKMLSSKYAENFKEDQGFDYPTEYS